MTFGRKIFGPGSWVWQRSSGPFANVSSFCRANRSGERSVSRRLARKGLHRGEALASTRSGPAFRSRRRLSRRLSSAKAFRGASKAFNRRRRTSPVPTRLTERLVQQGSAKRHGGLIRFLVRHSVIFRLATLATRIVARRRSVGESWRASARKPAPNQGIGDPCSVRIATVEWFEDKGRHVQTLHIDGFILEPRKPSFRSTSPGQADGARVRRRGPQ